MSTVGTISTPKTRPTVVSLDASQLEALSNEGVDTVKEVSESANHIAGEYTSMCSDTFAAALQSSSQVAQMMSDIGRTYADACACCVSTMAEISRDSMACRNPADMVALQKKSMDGFHAMFEVSAKVYGGIFAAWSKAAEPLVARMSDAPERMFRSVADYGGVTVRAPGADSA